MSKVKRVSSVEFLEAVTVKINELKAMFEDHNQYKSLIVIATGIRPDGKSKVVVEVSGENSALVNSLSQVMQHKETKPLFQKAIAMANKDIEKEAIANESIEALLARLFGNK